MYLRYVQHGLYKEHLISIVKKGITGAEEIDQMMVDLRKNPPKELDASPVTWVYDYGTSIAENIVSKEKQKITIPKSNVLIYETADGTKVAARPSGTEPKIKFYFGVNAPLDNLNDAELVEQTLDAKIQRIIKEMNL